MCAVGEVAFASTEQLEHEGSLDELVAVDGWAQGSCEEVECVCLGCQCSVHDNRTFDTAGGNKVLLS